MYNPTCNGPMVVGHARVLLASDPEGACSFLEADVCDPASILKQAAATLDFTQPTAVLLIAILHFIPDAEDPAGIVEELADALISTRQLRGDLPPDR